MNDHADLLLFNARVLTGRPSQVQSGLKPAATAVVVRGEAIAAVGSAGDLAGLGGPRTRRIDCQGMTLMPGLVDAHCHLLALASRWQDLDGGPGAVRSIEELKQAVQLRARTTPPDRWIRGFGYDDFALNEGRHPTRWDLDEAAPQHPVRLEHRSGHATVLNTRALELAGIHRDTTEPVEGVIVRDENTGEPTGLLLELASFLRQRLGHQRDKNEFERGIAYLKEKLLRYGITSVQDAGPGNDLARWETFRGLKASGKLPCRVTMLAGESHLTEFVSSGLRFGDGDQGLRLGPAKIMLTLTTGAPHPDTGQLADMIGEAHRTGFPVAIHAVEREAVTAAAEAIWASPPTSSSSGMERRFARSWPRDRIEHCAECPPDLVSQVRRCGGMVVTQPGFIYWNGDGYLQHVAHSLLPHLYPIGALARSRVPLAFGSDAPVIDPNPWSAIGSAVTRATRSGRTLGGDTGSTSSGQGVSVEQALRMYTAGGALAEGSQAWKGTIRRGKVADLVLLDADPTEIAPSKIKDIQVVLTVLGGQVVWDAGLYG